MSNKEKLSVFELSNKPNDRKDRYRQGEEKKKFTYNFITDPRLKRGLNLSVVFVTNETMEDEAPEQNLKRPQQKIAHTTDSNEKKKKDDGEYRAKTPPGKCREEIRTSPVLITTRPKPLTFEIDVQTEEKWRDKPEFIPYWPKQEGIEKDVQVEDGELFCFDVEVQPILNVLLSKVLEKSRMEVLEEEEIREMKAQQNYFHKLREAELKEIRDREKEENDRRDKNLERKKKMLEVRETTRKFQKKLFARTLAKDYLSQIRYNTLNLLHQSGYFQNIEEKTYLNNLGEKFREEAENLYKDDGVVLKDLNGFFQQNYTENKKVLHLQSIKNEYQRRKDEVARKAKELEDQAEERRQRKLDILKRKKDQELKELKELLSEEFIKHSEFVDEVLENGDYVGSYQLNKKQGTLSGGFLGAWTFVISCLTVNSPDLYSGDKLGKIFDLFLPKMPQVVLLYSAELVEKLKAVDDQVNHIEDFIKTPDEENFNKMVELFIENTLSINPTFEVFLATLSSYEFTAQTYKDVFHSLIKTLLKTLRSGVDASVSDKIKILLKDPSISDENFKGIGFLEVPSIPKTVAPPKKAGKGGKSVVKLIFEPQYAEKCAIVSSINEKMKMLIVNNHYEKMYKNNILECINLNQKLDDLDKAKRDIEEKSEAFSKKYIEALQKEYSLEKFDYNLDELSMSNMQ